MLVYSFSARTENQLADIIAAYLRRNYKVLQIVVNPNSKEPYKVFLVNLTRYNNILKNFNIENFEESKTFNLRTLELNEKIVNELLKNTYEIDIKIPKKFRDKLHSILYGNEDCFNVDGIDVYFGKVVILKDKIILKDAFECVTNQKVILDELSIKKSILYTLQLLSKA